MEPRSSITILGASGLIGRAVAETLIRDGFPVTAVARRFTPAQAEAFGGRAVVAAIAELDSTRLAAVLTENGTDIVLNCIGVLQDGPRGRTLEVHEAFVGRLLQAVAVQPKPVLLIHVSVPGSPNEDATAFSRTKRQGERLVTTSGLPFVILRPGFVIAPAAYGGSALIRALAALPIRLPEAVAARPFAATAVGDIARTVAEVARAWSAGRHQWSAVWDVADRQSGTVGGMIEAFRARYGGPPARVTIPGWALAIGARAGDLVARLGWSPPVRTTALREMKRGVTCQPEPWIGDTGLIPTPLAEAVRALPATVQELWFGRLFLLKPLMIVTLAVFWIASGLIALTVAFAPAAAILIAHGFSSSAAWWVTAVSSLVDIGIGAAVACRRTCRAGLLAGVAVSVFYMISAALITPDMWLEPLGALVKTAPAIVLMLVAVAILDDR